MGITGNNQPSLNEMVFENRNKTYGAYVLRRDYDLALIKSLVIALLFFGGLVTCYRLIPKAKQEPAILIEPVKWTETTYTIPPATKPVPKPPSHNTHPTPQTSQNAVPLVVENISKKDSVKPETNNDPDPGKTGEPIAENTGKGTTGPPPAEIAPEPDPVNVAEEMPEYPGGEKKLIEYLKSNIRYPREAIRQEVSGTVLMRFVVDAQGAIRQIEFLHKIGAGCEAEAQRVVESMPRWKPGKMKGRAVPVYFYLPVSYQFAH